MMLDLVSGAPGQIVAAALFINSKSCSDIFTVKLRSSPVLGSAFPYYASRIAVGRNTEVARAKNVIETVALSS